MSQLNRPKSQVARTAPTTTGRTSSLDLGRLHQALPGASLVPQQSGNSIRPTRGQQENGRQGRKSVSSLTRRTPGPSPSNEATRAVSLPERQSGAQGGRMLSGSTRSARPAVAERRQLLSTTGKGNRRLGNSQASVGKKGLADVTKLTEHEGAPKVGRLPPDLLCQCFTSTESLYYLVNCASVCRSWREALLSDTVWKTIYLKWWLSAELDGPSDGQTKMLPHQDSRNVPEGYGSWRSAFIARYQEGKKELLLREKARAVGEGYLHVRDVADRHGKRAFDVVQGDGMQKLAGRLGLTFNISLSRCRQIKVQGKGKMDIFQSSCIVRYPAKLIGNLDLAALKSIEVTATSDKLLRTCPIINLTRLPLATWEMVSMTSPNAGPMRLLQQRITSGVSLIVGTLAEEISLVDGINGEEQVLLIVLSIHLSDLLWKLMDLGEGPSSLVSRRMVRDELDPHYGLHSWNLSVQFHTFRKKIWTRNFMQVFWDPRESILGEKAVFLLVSHHEVFPGVLELPWKSEAFSGTLRGIYLLDVTLWDGGGEIAWQSSSAVRIDPTPLAVVEYGIGFDGQRVHSHLVDKERGVTLGIEMCIPLDMTNCQPTEERPMIAITNMKLGLTKKFLEDWCGMANI